MDHVIRRRVVVQPGGYIELNDAELQDGVEAEVIVIVRLPGSEVNGRQTALDLLDGLPGSKLFKTSQEADEYLRGERESWER